MAHLIAERGTAMVLSSAWRAVARRSRRAVNLACVGVSGMSGTTRSGVSYVAVLIAFSFMVIGPTMRADRSSGPVGPMTLLGPKTEKARCVCSGPRCFGDIG